MKRMIMLAVIWEVVFGSMALAETKIVTEGFTPSEYFEKLLVQKIKQAEISKLFIEIKSSGEIADIQIKAVVSGYIIFHYKFQVKNNVGEYERKLIDDGIENVLQQINEAKKNRLLEEFMANIPLMFHGSPIERRGERFIYKNMEMEVRIAEKKFYFVVMKENAVVGQFSTWKEVEEYLQKK